MRSNPAEYEMVSPGTLAGVLRLLQDEPGQWLPVAGGTEVMVQFSAGRLGARRLVNLWNLPELREIREEGDTVVIGGGCTFSQIRDSAAVRKHFPLLSQAASWTGSIANQNRATIAGNLANASPAADSSPSLLAYDAEIELASAAGARRIPYSAFHLGYKKTALRPDELIVSIRLRKHSASYFSYARKTGARNAQAISKVCIAGMGRMRDGRVDDIRIGIGAVAPTPLRLSPVEAALLGEPLSQSAIVEARRVLDRAIQPIDDIRSEAEYRKFVAGNLLQEFLALLAASSDAMNPVLAQWNLAPEAEAIAEVLSCCGSSRWAQELAKLRPFPSPMHLLEASNRVWRNLQARDWDEAFRCHPRIGERRSAAAATQKSAAWSREEQNGVDTENVAILAELARGNEEYEQRFGRVFLVCATGKSAREMLEILHRRLNNNPADELLEAAEQQRQITQIRLQKWLGL